jgi:PadR family transcriptional regulator PadR
MKQKPDLPQGTLDLLVLKALSLGETHGYGVGLRIAQLADDMLRVEEGTLYPALYRRSPRSFAFMSRCARATTSAPA